MNNHTLRAHLLIQQANFPLAEKEAREALGIDPNDAQAYGFLAICLNQQNKNEEALNCAREARRLDPDNPVNYYLVGAVHYSLGNRKRSRENLERSLELDPDSVETLGMMSALEFRESRFSQALEYAESGLRIESDDPLCNNIRSQALIKMGRKEEAGWSVESNLQLNPDDPYVHATAGWNHLERGNRAQAEEHFLESLRLAPGNESARSGLINSIKARNFIFQQFLNYQFALSRMSEGKRWAIIIGIFILFRVVVRAADGIAVLALVATYVGFTLFTWCAGEFFNLLLFFHPLGRHALTVKEKLSTIGLIGILLSALAFVIMAFVFGKVILGVFGFALILLIYPYSAAIRAEMKRTKVILYPIFAVMCCLVVGGFLLELLHEEAGAGILYIGMLGSGLSTWIANAVLQREA